MKKRDFDWCFNHENLFQGWLYYISFYNSLKNPHLMLDNDGIFLLWQEAKEYALQIAKSNKPVLLFDSTMSGIIIKNPDYKVFIIMFICSMCLISDNKILNLLGTSRNRVYIKLKYWHDRHLVEVYEVIFDRILNGSIKRDYDYSLPDGGIKDETETDETITKTKTKTDAGTITKTKTDGSVKLPDVLDTNEFKNLLSLAKENGLIKDVDGKLEWIQIGDYGGSSQLAYFLGMAFGYKHSVNGNIGNQFPGKELDELFGVKRIYRLLVQVHSAPKPQKWRKKIDEFFNKNRLLVRRDLTLSSSSSEGIA